MQGVPGSLDNKTLISENKNHEFQALPRETTTLKPRNKVF